MNGINFHVDTNFLIYLLNGHRAIEPYLNNNFFISEITEMEMLGIKDIQTSVIKMRTALIENCFIVNFNSDIKEIAIRIKQKTAIKTARRYNCSFGNVYGNASSHSGQGFHKNLGPSI